MQPRCSRNRVNTYSVHMLQVQLNIGLSLLQPLFELLHVWPSRARVGRSRFLKTCQKKRVLGDALHWNLHEGFKIVIIIASSSPPSRSTYKVHPLTVLLRISPNPAALHTIKKELRFIRRRTVFSICETFRNILSSSFSFSRFCSKRLALPCLVQ